MWSQRDHKILIGAEGDCALVLLLFSKTNLEIMRL